MNPLSATAQDMFKCSFCQLSFVDVVKAVPDCGALICGACHDDLNSPSDSNRQFRCKSCHKDHNMPKEGLADVKAIMEMLKFKPEKLVTEKDGEAEGLKNQIEDVREKINRLESFNSQEEINVYCDQLKSQVSDALESSIKSFNNLHDEMQKQIDEYRERLLQERQSTPEPQAEDELAELSKQLNELSEQSAHHEIQLAKVQTKDVVKNVKQVKNKLTGEALNNRYLRFRGGHDSAKNQFGRLVFENTANGKLIEGIKIFVVALYLECLFSGFH